MIRWENPLLPQITDYGLLLLLLLLLEGEGGSRIRSMLAADLEGRESSIKQFISWFLEAVPRENKQP
jgi:hypothetical protein